MKNSLIQLQFPKDEEKLGSFMGFSDNLPK